MRSKESLSVYLAGPDVFMSAEVADFKKKQLIDHGFKPLFPLDNEIHGEDAAREIFKANLRMIDRAEYVLANITPFRGVSCDPGTAMEIGYAFNARKTIIAYSSDSRTLKARIAQDFKSYSNDGMTIEDFGLIDNLMISTLEHVLISPNTTDVSAKDAFLLAVKRLKDLVAMRSDEPD